MATKIRLLVALQNAAQDAAYECIGKEAFTDVLRVGENTSEFGKKKENLAAWEWMIAKQAKKKVAKYVTLNRSATKRGMNNTQMQIIVKGNESIIRTSSFRTAEMIWEEKSFLSEESP